MIKIERDKLYTPRQIAGYKFILSGRGQISYNYVLALIKAGKLKAVKTGMKGNPYWRVFGSEILRYRSDNKLFIENKEETETDNTNATPVAQS